MSDARRTLLHARWRAHARGDVGALAVALARGDDELHSDPAACVLEQQLAALQAREPAGALEALRGSPDRDARARAYRSRAAVGAACAPVLEALWARRRAARPDYFARALAAGGLDGARLARLIAEREPATRDAWRAAASARAAQLGVTQLAPWDLYVCPGDWRARLAPYLAAAPVPAGFDEPAAGGFAATYALDPPHDVRVVAPAPGDQIFGWARLWHEFGHARFARTHAQPAPAWRDEAAADAHAREVWSAAWLTSYARVPADLAAEVEAAGDFERVLEQRLRLVRACFERDMYAGVGEPTARWWALYAAHLGVVDEECAPTWARIPHFVSHPASSAVYLAADADDPE